MNRTKKKTAAFTLTALAIIIVAVGCNRENGKVASKGGGSGGDVAARTAYIPEAVTPGAAQLAETTLGASMEAESTPRGDETEVTPVEFLPPDVVASETDLVAAPGTIVEIVAEGSDDVVEMTLSDGGRTPTAFRYDENAGLWRASYRMPLRPASDRIGLSVTAKNASQRWRRVWVFLKAPHEMAEADSGSGC